MHAYFAINGNNETAKVYDKALTREELAVSVLPYKSFEAASAALDPYRLKRTADASEAVGHKVPLNIINLGYVRFRPRVAAVSVPESESEPVPVPQAETENESETTNPSPES